METAKIEKPIVVNGAVLTGEVLDAINYLQTGGTWGRTPEEITNEGYKDHEQQLREVTDYLVEKIALSAKDEDCSREINLLGSVYFVKDTLQRLRAPEGKLEM